MFFFENYFVAILGDSSQLIAASSFYLSSPRRPFACLVSRGLFACLVPLMTYSTYPIKLPCIDRAVVDSFFLEARFASTIDVVVPSGISDVLHSVFWKVFSIRSFWDTFPGIELHSAYALSFAWCAADICVYRAYSCGCSICRSCFYFIVFTATIF